MVKTKVELKSVVLFLVMFFVLVLLETTNTAWAHPPNDTVPGTVPGTVPVPPAPPSGPIIPPKNPLGALPSVFYYVPDTVPGAGGDTSIAVGSDAVPGGTKLITTLFYPNGIPHGAFRTIYNHIVAVRFEDADGNPITTLSAPIQVCFQLSADDVAAAGGPDRIAIEWWDWQHGKWVALDTSPGRQPNQFCAPASQL